MKIWGSKTIQNRNPNTWWNWNKTLKNTKLTQACEPYDELLIRNIAESYYFNDDVNYIVGKIMRETKGKANPAIVEQIVKEVKGIK